MIYIYIIHTYIYIYLCIPSSYISCICLHLHRCWSEISSFLGQAGPEPGGKSSRWLGMKYASWAKFIPPHQVLLVCPTRKCGGLLWLKQMFEGAWRSWLHDGQVAAGGMLSGGSCSMVRKMIYKLGMVLEFRWLDSAEVELRKVLLNLVVFHSFECLQI